MKKLKLRDDFALFILCYGRPDNVVTYKTLCKHGYTGKIFFITSDDDKTLERYKENFGAERVLTFNKTEVAKNFDLMDNQDNNRCAVFARNACFSLAESVNIRYFVQLDDDYKNFGFRYPRDGKLRQIPPPDIDNVFLSFLEYFESTPQICSLAFAQGGDFIGGLDGSRYQKKILRKTMNSWFCDTSRPIKFNGRMNDDVNTYALNGSQGRLFFTITDFMIEQPATQQVTGGMTEMYTSAGTYQKSFYTTLCCLSFAKVAVMGDHHFRIHHHIATNNAYPKIISDRYKKGIQ